MTRLIPAASVAAAIAGLLTACASTPPTAPAPAGTAARTQAAATAGETELASAKDPRIGKRYRLVVRNGTEYYCTRERVIGSLTSTSETCLTEKQLLSQSQETQDMLNRVKGNPGDQPSVDSGDGTFNSAIAPGY